MKERPIIFNPEMIKAIIDGRKTMTRRIMKVQPDSPNFGLLRITDSTKRADIGKYHWAESNATGTHTRSALFTCPFGAVGDRLWVRETWQAIHDSLDEFGNVDERTWMPSIPKSSDSYWHAVYAETSGQSNREDRGFPWRPSTHMPRWASRITLEITGVRVERLQDISQADAIAEGAPPSHPSIDAVSRDYGFPDFSRSWFGQTWWSIYGEESWQANPWVWVIEFKRVEG
ncbi:hypothetical protein [Mixta mediterraneensis]|uniref:hypothetical protein n=1 Tax=Mixta mediterraneensis TaxID=2758443 RepID=UPI001873BE3F|nr:hypothetical protein [Mixta mediterraneensis]MBE5251589.1 hypothetical protein [Mixta mediterraneensis]